MNAKEFDSKRKEHSLRRLREQEARLQSFIDIFLKEASESRFEDGYMRDLEYDIDPLKLCKELKRLGYCVFYYRGKIVIEFHSEPYFECHKYRRNNFMFFTTYSTVEPIKKKTFEKYKKAIDKEWAYCYYLL